MATLKVADILYHHRTLKLFICMTIALKHQQLFDRMREMSHSIPLYLPSKSTLDQFSPNPGNVKPSDIFSECISTDKDVNIRTTGRCTLRQQIAAEEFCKNTNGWKNKMVRRIGLSPIHTTGSFWFCYEKPYELVNDTGKDHKHWKWEISELSRLRVCTTEGQILNVNMYTAASKPILEHDNDEIINTHKGIVNCKISTILSQEDIMIPFYKLWFYKAESVHLPNGIKLPLPLNFTAVWFEKGLDDNGNQTFYDWLPINNYPNFFECIKRNDDLYHTDAELERGIFNIIDRSNYFLDIPIENLFEHVGISQSDYHQCDISDFTVSYADNFLNINDFNLLESFTGENIMCEEQLEQMCEYMSRNDHAVTTMDSNEHGCASNVLIEQTTTETTTTATSICTDVLNGTTTENNGTTTENNGEYVKVHIVSFVNGESHKRKNHDGGLPDESLLLTKGSLICDEPVFTDESEQVVIEILEMGKVGVKRKRENIKGNNSKMKKSLEYAVKKEKKKKPSKSVTQKDEMKKPAFPCCKQKYIYFGRRTHSHK